MEFSIGYAKKIIWNSKTISKNLVTAVSKPLNERGETIQFFLLESLKRTFKRTFNRFMNMTEIKTDK